MFKMKRCITMFDFDRYLLLCIFGTIILGPALYFSFNSLYVFYKNLSNESKEINDVLNHVVPCIVLTLTLFLLYFYGFYFRKVLFSTFYSNEKVFQKRFRIKKRIAINEIKTIIVYHNYLILSDKYISNFDSSINIDLKKYGECIMVLVNYGFDDKMFLSLANGSFNVICFKCSKLMKRHIEKYFNEKDISFF